MPNSPSLSPAVVERQQELRDAFASAQPFRHVVIDDFLSLDFATSLLDQFPDFAARQ